MFSELSGWFMVTTFNNISVISWWSVLLVEETRVLRRKSLTNFIPYRKSGNFGHGFILAYFGP
jgi:hypothetical protein